MINTIKYLLKRIINILSRLIPLPRSLDDTYILEDHSQVCLYVESEAILPAYRPRELIKESKRPSRVPFSLICTVYNEAKSVSAWMDRVLKQSQLPEELVIVVAQSTDDTLSQLESYQDQCPFPLRIIKAGKVNISCGRNIAIKEAEHDIIAVSDFGCRPRQDWLEKLILPFAMNPEIEVVAGWYESVNQKG